MNDISLPAGEFLAPVEPNKKKRKSVFGALAHCTHILGDIEGPSDYWETQIAETIREWDEIEAALKPSRRKTP